MTEFKREFFKNDPVMRELFLILKQNHKVAEHTQKTLYENRHVKDFCEEARHFVFMGGNKPLMLHYDVASWFLHPDTAQVRIESIGIYDSFMEYETARMKGLHSGKQADIPNIN